MIVKLYSDSNRYKGFRNADYRNNFLELKSWLESGNYLVVRNEKITSVKRISELLKNVPSLEIITEKT